MVGVGVFVDLNQILLDDGLELWLHHAPIRLKSFLVYIDGPAGATGVWAFWAEALELRDVLGHQHGALQVFGLGGSFRGVFGHNESVCVHSIRGAAAMAKCCANERIV